jgi:predicted phosphatase
LKEWRIPDFLNTPSTTNLEEEEIVETLGNDGNASMPEHVNRPNPWRKMMMMMMVDSVKTKSNVKII